MTRPRKVNPPPKALIQRTPASTSSRSTRRQGMIFSTSNLPQEIKDLQGAGPKLMPPPPPATSSSKRQDGKRKGMMFDINNLPQELKNLRDDAPPRNNTRPA
ncbi:hypothetical protein PCANC_04702 [Puccinia coronata f. sp. avenae]|uniref:Uncharacterized protein n=1 Tax=Puccinia coronata f. sp. avenae TaxID=200324 RepID=A0A2N5W1M3_9BASI|nr:hypothetical protein PCANC_15051 [Puccinia coronata f. sp. avenae]PLW43486.1 hypothetical protein PCASD_06766 [Puccinia coronata f. sp. avenae]PLW56151.1 hypothetical protein PCANC_04702 [Puccinia coronata f. sp. avenae]